jgi:AmmeMemoRadiSam system protein B
MRIRPAAVAGTWYPGTASALAAAVDRHLAAADRVSGDLLTPGDLVAIIAPHAGLMYSGPVAAHAYRLLRNRTFDVAVLVGPSHFVGFDGVSIYPSGGFATPFGVAPIDADCASAIVAASQRPRFIREHAAAHAREHSLEMQLPFLEHLAPGLPIVPLVMGHQTAATARALGDALAKALSGRRALLVASTDLSHYNDAATASRLDAVVIECVARFDADGLQRVLDAGPGHACGGGPTVAVMRAAWLAGARDAAVLNYADSGDVSGDKSAVVGYLAAALGTCNDTKDTKDTKHTKQTKGADRRSSLT